MLPGDVEVGERLVTHPDVAMIHFTGSTTVGRQIAPTAGGLLKKVSLELGGNNALIVLDDADLDQATMIGAWSSFHYQGQTCITAGRHIVQRGVADAYVGRAGGPRRRDHRRQHGDRGRRPRPDDQLQAARPGRRRCWTRRWPTGAADRRGRHHRRAVLPADGRHRTSAATSRLWTEEIFAPIAPVLVVDDDDEAVAVANDTAYGLVNSVLTGDPYRGVQVARRLRAGMVHVNDATPQDEALAPFGGIGQSGLGGRSGGDANIEEFTERRWLTVNPRPCPLSVLTSSCSQRDAFTLRGAAPTMQGSRHRRQAAD